MANKGYYYLKLKENFFDTDEMKILESMENGYLYSNILLKLYLKALKNEGKLTFNEYIPYDTKMLATITGHNIDVVEKAIAIFKGMHLIEVLDNGTIFMLDMQKLIGSISSEGVRKAEYREKISLEKKESGTKLGQCPNIISNSISNSNSNIKEKKDDIDSIIESIEDDKLKNALKEFIKMRKSIKKPLTEYGLELIIKKLNKMSVNIDEQVQILEQSIENCWQGLFEVKKKETKQESDFERARRRLING